MNNPFIAEPEDDTTPITGIGLLEAGQAALDGINNGDWVEAGLGVVGVGLEALGVGDHFARSHCRLARRRWGRVPGTGG